MSILNSMTLEMRVICLTDGTDRSRPFVSRIEPYLFDMVLTKALILMKPLRRHHVGSTMQGPVQRREEARTSSHSMPYFNMPYMIGAHNRPVISENGNRESPHGSNSAPASPARGDHALVGRSIKVLDVVAPILTTRTNTGQQAGKQSKQFRTDI